MSHFGWSELGIVLAMLVGLALQVAVVVAGAWIALILWHRRPHGRVRE